MPQRVAITHRTSYTFDRPVLASPHVVRLRPVASPWTAVVHHEQRITPDEHVVHWKQDPFGNPVARVSFLGPVDGIGIEVEVVADLAPRNPFDFLLDPAAGEYPFGYGEELAADLRPNLESGDPAPGGAELRPPSVPGSLIVTTAPARRPASSVNCGGRAQRPRGTPH